MIVWPIWASTSCSESKIDELWIIQGPLSRGALEKWESESLWIFAETPQAVSGSQLRWGSSRPTICKPWNPWKCALLSISRISHMIMLGQKEYCCISCILLEKNLHNYGHYSFTYGDAVLYSNISLTISQDFPRPAQSWIWGLRTRGWWWEQSEGSSQAPARPAHTIYSSSSAMWSEKRHLVQGVEKALEPDEVANHPEDAQEPHHPHRPHDLAGLLGLNQNLTIDRSPTCPIIFMFSSPARMTENMVGRIPTRSTRFILSETNFLLFGQTSRRKKYLDMFLIPKYFITRWRRRQ